MRSGAERQHANPPRPTNRSNRRQCLVRPRDAAFAQGRDRPPAGRSRSRHMSPTFGKTPPVQGTGARLRLVPVDPHIDGESSRVAACSDSHTELLRRSCSRPATASALRASWLDARRASVSSEAGMHVSGHFSGYDGVTCPAVDFIGVFTGFRGGDHETSPNRAVSALAVRRAPCKALIHAASSGYSLATPFSEGD